MYLKLNNLKNREINLFQEVKCLKGVKIFSLSLLLIFSVLSITFTACGGGSSSNDGGGNGGTTGVIDVDGLGLPAAGGTGPISLTNGTNKYGLKKLWKSWDDEDNDLCIAYIFNSIDACLDDDRIVIYLGDNNIYIFCAVDSSTFYLIGSFPYEYDNNEKKLIAKGPNTVNSMYFSLDGKINITDDKFMILSLEEERYDLIIYTSYAELSGTVVVADDAILAELDHDDADFDEGLVHPEINLFTASYDSNSKKVTVDYKITAPGTEDIKSVAVSFVSPTLHEKHKKSEEYIVAGSFSIFGQYLPYMNLVYTLDGNTVEEGSKEFELTAPENGIWHIDKIFITTDSNYYILRKEVNGNWESNYYVHSDDNDKYKDTGVATATFTVSGSEPDTTAPTLTGVSKDGDNIKITFSGDCTQANIICIPQGQGGEDSRSEQYWFGGFISDDDEATVPLYFMSNGSYYIALIALTDAAGNSSVYFGYDTTVSFWSTDYGLGLDFSKYKRYWANEKLPDDTDVDVLKFDK